MISPTRFYRACAVFALIIAAATAYARAQEAAPAPVASPTLMDREYDGNTHITVAPYIWGPSVKADYQFAVPVFARRVLHRPPHLIAGNVTVTPQQYAANLNSAAMFAIDARKGNADLFGDIIYVNASASASAYSTLTLGREGRIVIPMTFSTDAHLSTAIWEVAAGYTVARGHDADLTAFAGLREFPVNTTISYNATIGRRGIIAPSGTLTADEYTSDIVAGLKGRAFFGDGHWFIPYYADIGTGVSISNQSWQAIGGGGYEFNHGQTLVATWRALNYYGFPPDKHVQRLSMGGPLLGYTFNI